MSGHSKWHKVKHRKAATDSKKSKLFGQLAREIKSAARHGNDPAKNSILREAIERAKKTNVPQINIDRLLSQDASAVQSATYEGYGAGGVAILVNTETDNTNRTVSELRSLFKEHGGSLGEPGSVRWKFSERAEVAATIPEAVSREELELELIDAGAEDIHYDDAMINLIGAPDTRFSLEAALQKHEATITSTHLISYVPPAQQISITADQQEQLVDLISALEERDDVITVFTDAADTVK